VFITLEGVEGSGKSTLAAALAGSIADLGLTPILTREPGEGAFGRAVRELLLHGQCLCPTTELFLFLADRSEHVAQFLRPALARGAVVVCDRYADSTVVYQGYARGLDIAWIRDLNDKATNGLNPDLTLLLDLPPEVGLERLRATDRLDREPIEFHRRVREGFLAEAARDPDRWRILDATESPKDLARAAWHELLGRLQSLQIRHHAND
jgi:dTMP kinase